MEGAGVEQGELNILLKSVILRVFLYDVLNHSFRFMTTSCLAKYGIKQNGDQVHLIREDNSNPLKTKGVGVDSIPDLLIVIT